MLRQHTNSGRVVSVVSVVMDGLIDRAIMQVYLLFKALNHTNNRLVVGDTDGEMEVALFFIQSNELRLQAFNHSKQIVNVWLFVQNPLHSCA